MKKITVSNLFMLILIVGLSIIAYSLWQDVRSLKSENQVLVKNQGEAANTLIDTYVDKADSSISHTVFQDRIVTRNALKEGQVPISKTLLDSMVQGLKIADGDRQKFLKHINELTRVVGTLKGTIQGFKGDPAKGVLFDFNSPYLKANIDTSYRLNYRYNAEIRIAAIHEPSGFLGLGKGNNYVDISSPDPNFTINSVDRFRVETPVKVKPWGIGIIGGYTASPNGNNSLQLTPSLGVGVSYNFIRF